jgi:Siphovirus Gp157
MNDQRIDFEKLRYIAIRDKLLESESEIDEQTLADTTEGLTDLHDLLAAAIRGALEDETLAAVLKLRMQEMADRLERFQARAERRREIVRDAMLDCDINQLKRDDFTASLRQSPPKVVVLDEKQIPQTFWEPRPHLRKRELLDALKDGAHVEGAMLSNPGMSLSVRTR